MSQSLFGNIFLDATYKLLELRLPVYLFTVETEVVTVGILVTETEDNVKWVLQSLQEKNPERVFIVDKDFNERAIIKELFPTATVLICLFHSLRSLKGR